MWKIAIFPVFLVAFLLIAYLAFYRGAYTAPVTPQVPVDEIVSVPSAGGAYTDLPVFEASPIAGSARGHLLIDAAHRNNMLHPELNVLLSRVSARGYSSSFFEAGSTVSLAEELSQADAFLVVLPADWFAPDEIEAVVKFVEEGGRVLLVGDPGRFFHLNDLAEPLGIFFRPDYLYNLHEYDSNFREIFVRDFQADPITTGVNEMALYYAGSLDSAGPGLAFTGGQTRSSTSEVIAPQASIAIGAHRNVLAVYDWTFMIPPYSSIKDNAQMVSNIADFLTGGDRTYRLAEFPRFFQGEVDILLGNPDLVTQGAAVRQLLVGVGMTAQISGSEYGGRDTVFLALFDDPSSVFRYLEANGIELGETMSTSFINGISLEGRSLMLLDSTGDQASLIIMADTAEGLDSAIGLLGSGGFRDGLVDDTTGVFETK